jgi:dienelactone hydrolase
MNDRAIAEIQSATAQSVKGYLSRHQRRLIAAILPMLYVLGLITGAMLQSKGYLAYLEYELGSRREPAYESVTIPEFLSADAFALTLSKQDLSTPKEVAAWQQQIRTQAQTLLGLEDEVGTVPTWRAETTVSRDGYFETWLTIVAPDGDTIVAYKLVPEGLSGPAAAVLVVPGSGNGVAGVVGHIKDYQQQIGVELVRAGYVVYAIENRGWGERAIDVGSMPYGPSNVYAVYSLQRGRPLASRYVADVGVVLRLMSADPEVDSQRIALVGCSLGSGISVWAGAMFPQVAAVAVASGLRRDAETWTYSYIDQMIVPGMFAYFDHADVASTIAPRPLLLTYGMAEPGQYGIEARTQEVYRHLQPVWAMLNAEERLQFVAHSGGHTYDVPATIKFLDETLARD